MSRERSSGVDSGWLGTREELRDALLAAGADRNSEGAFHLEGSIVSFMGAGEEFVVGTDAVYFKKGEPRSLLALLDKLEKGMKVKVF